MFELDIKGFVISLTNYNIVFPTIGIIICVVMFYAITNAIIMCYDPGPSHLLCSLRSHNSPSDPALVSLHPTLCCSFQHITACPR